MIDKRTICAAAFYALTTLALGAIGIAAFAQGFPGQGNNAAPLAYPQPSNWGTPTYSAGGGGSAASIVGVNRTFSFTTSSTTSTNITFAFAGGSYVGNAASPYVPNCTANLTTTAPGAVSTVATATTVEVLWATTGVSLKGSVLCQ